MKKMAGLVVILAVLVLGSYFGMGIVTERTLKRSVAMVGHTTPGLSVDLSDYNRRWFEASAAVKVKIHIPEKTVTNTDGKFESIAAQEFTLDVPLSIKHGPIMYTHSGVLFGLGSAHTKLNLPKEAVDRFNQYFAADSTHPYLNLSVFVNYLNQSRFQFKIPTFKLILKEGGEVTWQGMDGTMHVSSDLKQFDGRSKLDGIRFIKDQVTAEINAFTTDYLLKKTNDGLYLGQAGFAVDAIKAAKQGQALFDLAQLKVRTDSAVSNNLFESSFKTSFDKILLETKQYGPGLFEMSIKNLDAKVLANINTEVNNLQNASVPDRQRMLFAMLPELPKLFAQGAEFEISTLKLTVPDGDIDGHLRVALPKTENVNPLQILQKVEGDGKIQVPTAVVKQLLIMSLLQKATVETSPQGQMNPQLTQSKPADTQTTPQPATENQTSQPVNTATVSPDTQTKPLEIQMQQATTDAETKLAALIQANLLVEQGKNYVIELHLAEGKFTVNGRPFDPNAFKF
jgi:uncharacterized protein YdgA (DUF945 family)